MEPFVWNMDEYWSSLETEFKAAKSLDDSSLSSRIVKGFTELDSLLVRLHTDKFPPDSPLFASIESGFFTLGVLLSAKPYRLGDYIELYSAIRKLIKSQSIHWDMNSNAARDCIYRILYGGRTAIEEVIMQSAREDLPQIVLETDEPSITPSANILGVDIHSGDILVSRGGAPTSALIARGNDYPGNFSHAALTYVDENTGEISIIESLIEKGVVITAVEDYLKDTKLRMMILRVRSDLPKMQADPMLAHKAAAYVLKRVNTEHIIYDFAMDGQDDSKFFCSEVVLEAYRHFDIELWAALSNISRAGVRSWLSVFGVENFTTQEPSDLEYDPKLCVVAEWRDYETLFKDRLDNAVVDVMLEGADMGDRINYDFYLLPLARIVKVYSSILNQFDGVGQIPEGMNATAALRNKRFSKKHQGIKEKLLILTHRFKQDNAYSPPYWEIVKLARQASLTTKSLSYQHNLLSEHFVISIQSNEIQSRLQVGGGQCSGINAALPVPFKQRAYLLSCYVVNLQRHVARDWHTVSDCRC